MAQVGLQAGVAGFQAQAAAIVRNGPAKVVNSQVGVAKVVMQLGVAHLGIDEALIALDRLPVITLGLPRVAAAQGLLKSPVGLGKEVQLLRVG